MDKYKYNERLGWLGNFFLKRTLLVRKNQVLPEVGSQDRTPRDPYSPGGTLSRNLSENLYFGARNQDRYSAVPSINFNGIQVGHSAVQRRPSLNLPNLKNVGTRVCIILE